MAEPKNVIPEPTELIRRDGVEVAKYADDEGTPELRQHAHLEESEVRVGAQTRRRPRTVDLARTMRRAGAISFAAESAWREFNRDFFTARIEPSQTCDFAATPVSGSRTAAIIDEREDAKDRIAKALKVLGGHGSASGNAAWYVFGEGLGIVEWAAREVFAKGKSLSPSVARGIVIGTAGVLEAHYAEQKGGKRRQ